MVLETIRLYGFWRSQASYRVRIALALKELRWEETAINVLAGEQYGGDIAAHNSQFAVPMLVDDGWPLTQSLAIIEYLEECYPRPALFPDGARARAEARSFALITVADAHPFTVPRVHKQLAEMFGGGDKAFNLWVRHWQNQALQAMETRLAARRAKTDFCFGDRPGIADISLASHVSSALLSGIAVDDFAEVSAINRRCQNLPAFATHSPQALKPAGVS